MTGTQTANRKTEPGPRAKGRRGGVDRRCVVSGARGGRDGLVRFALGPDGAVVPDVLERLPGRGVWVTARRDTVEQAARRGLLARELGKTGAAVAAGGTDAALGDQVEHLLARHCLDLLGLARRTGAAVAGYEKVLAQLQSGAARILIGARDGAADGRGKLRARAGTATLVELFDREELDGALGRANCTHVAVAAGPLAERLLVECQRLAGFRAGAGDGRSVER